MSTRTAVLTEALLNTAKELGISTSQLQKIIGEDISHNEINPESKSGELALMLIRCYDNLYTLVGGNNEQIKHWMHTKNKGTQGIPAKQVVNNDGLARVTEYLDAMRNR